MKPNRLSASFPTLIVLALVTSLPATSACTPGSAPDVHVISFAGETNYLEERGNPFNTNPPAPGSAALVQDPNHQPILAKYVELIQEIAGTPVDQISIRTLYPLIDHALNNDTATIFFGEGTWWYRESNGLAGLQRGGTAVGGPCFPPPVDPGTPDFPQDDIDACVLVNTDPIDDENCEAGPDTIIAGLSFRDLSRPKVPSA